MTLFDFILQTAHTYIQAYTNAYLKEMQNAYGTRQVQYKNGSENRGGKSLKTGCKCNRKTHTANYLCRSATVEDLQT